MEKIRTSELRRSRTSSVDALRDLRKSLSIPRVNKSRDQIETDSATKVKAEVFERPDSQTPKRQSTLLNKLNQKIANIKRERSASRKTLSDGYDITTAKEHLSPFGTIVDEPPSVAHDDK